MTENPKEIDHLQSIISGKVIRKYRLRKYLQDMTDVDRRKVISNKKIMRSKKIKSYISNFLMRDDNSRCMPGKGDTVKVGGERTQKFLTITCIIYT